eukprot:scaffold149_cov315-Pinguiococcus_pyrenoidosus.AAC.8
MAKAGRSQCGKGIGDGLLVSSRGSADRLACGITYAGHREGRLPTLGGSPERPGSSVLLVATSHRPRAALPATGPPESEARSPPASRLRGCRSSRI